MVVISMTSKITSKGQTTLPKEIRDNWGSIPATPWSTNWKGIRFGCARRTHSTLPGIGRFPRLSLSGTPPTITRISMTCDAFEVVVVPFPFTDSDQSAKRPAAVVSRRALNAKGHTVMAMITDARNPPWPLDIRIDHQSAGLKMPSVSDHCHDGVAFGV